MLTGSSSSASAKTDQSSVVDVKLSRQIGPQCKVSALNAARSMLYCANDMPLYKHGDKKLLSSRSIAKQCGSAVGEVTSPEMLTKIGSHLGLTVEIKEYSDFDSYMKEIRNAFNDEKYVILFYQANEFDFNDIAVLPGKNQYLEHAITAINFMGGDEDNPTLITFDNGVARPVSSRAIFDNSEYVNKVRQTEYFYKHFSHYKDWDYRKVNIDGETVVLHPCPTPPKVKCHWHDLSQFNDTEKTPEMAKKLYEALEREPRLHKDLSLRKSITENGSFYKKIAVVSKGDPSPPKPDDLQATGHTTLSLLV